MEDVSGTGACGTGYIFIVQGLQNARANTSVQLEAADTGAEVGAVDAVGTTLK